MRYVAAGAVVLLVVTALVIVSQPKHTAAQTPSSLPTELEGLQAFSIIVEDLNPDAQQEQITKQALEDQVLVTIRSKAPILRYDPAASPNLYVRVTVLNVGSGVGFAADVVLELARPVEVLVGVHRAGQTPSKRVFTVATVWHRGFLITGPPATAQGRVRGVMDQMLEAFLADYFRANR